MGVSDKSQCMNSTCSMCVLYWVSLVGSILLVITPAHIGAVPMCGVTEYTTECSVKEQSDFSALPTNATRMHVYFTDDHQITLERGFFPVRPNLLELTIDLNHIRNDIQPGAFTYLPNLQSLTFIDTDQYRPLRSKRLRVGAFSGLNALKTLELEEIGVDVVDHGVFHNMPSLTKINIHNNFIPSLSTLAFVNTTQLENLILSKNRFTGVDDFTFRGLDKLMYLDLSQNSLSALGANSFATLGSLDELNLQENQISYIAPGTFTDLAQLKTLNLQDNRLGSIPRQMFQFLGNLINLDLSHNKLTQIEDKSFVDLENLEFLEIYDNQLNGITNKTFFGLYKLKFLDLYTNNITELKDNVFVHLRDLGSLHLHQANIHKLSVNTFNGLDALSILTLQFNNITALPVGVLKPFDQLAFIDLSGNPWDCTCAITWMHEWSNGKYLGSEMNTTCAATGEALLQYARDNYYNCRRTTTTSTTPIPPPTTTTPASTTVKTTTFKGVMEETTTASLVVLSSSVDPGYKTTPFNGTDTSAQEQSTIVLTPIVKIAIGVAVGIGALLIILLIIMACYCRRKKCAFWKPDQIQQPAAPRTPEKGDKSWLTLYSPSKDQNSFIDPEIGTPATNGVVKGENGHNGHAPGSKSYVNHGLHVDDVTNANHKAMERRAEEHPAVVAYAPKDPINNVLHSYSHSVSDSGTHHIDNNLPEDDHLNDLNQRPMNDSRREKKKKDKKSKDKKHKTSNLSSSDNENPYKDVYNGRPIAMSDHSPHSDNHSDNHDRDRHVNHDTYDDQPPYNPGYMSHGQREEFPMY